MNRALRTCAGTIALTIAWSVAACAADDASEVSRIEWTRDASYRLLVRVPAVALGDREQDERPAECVIDFKAQLDSLGIEARPDLTSLRVVACDPQTGKALPSPTGESDAAGRPFRWYDDAIPYEFPEFANAVSRTDGRIVRRSRVRGGYFFNVVGDWESGRLVWMHRPVTNKPTLYAIYFNLLSEGQLPDQLPPRGWVGDGLPRCAAIGRTTMGADHSRVELTDWNGDGLVDLLVGEHYGHVLWWPNLGTRQKPVFRYARFVFSDGQPLDAGIAAAPCVVDWDGDGTEDLLVGTHWNRLLYYRNVGTNDRRQLEYRGPVELDGEPLELPLTPLTRGSEGVFRRDYYPVPEAVDWDGDGDVDLLAGGYITGLIFFYENVGPGEEGTPRLRLVGPIRAGDGPLNVGHWCASPCVADFDGDGSLDLLTGNMPMYLQPDEQEQHRRTFLQYFTGHSFSGPIELEPRPFPGTGRFPHERLATPRAADWDDDGDLDLVVSARENIYLYENVGTPQRPDFRMHADPLKVPWGLATVPVDQFRDWNDDGHPDAVRGYTVHLNDGVGNPYRWSQTVSVLPPGQNIDHPSGIGDDWFWPYLDDFDQDGRVDVLFGDWFGHVWLHRNLSSGDEKQFDLAGIRLEAGGQPIKVGPLDRDPEKDFGALQGARTVLTVEDFDHDGRRDLVVGDTYGVVRFFRNAGGPPHEPRFDMPVEIGNLGIRGLVDATDWNEDGWPDVIASAASGRVRVFLNDGSGNAGFGDGFDPGLPPIVQPRVMMVDLNGDGDEDLFLPSTQGSCFVERSFLRHGYATAELMRIERRP
ncbi:FG-GAP repeat protein [Maioricimonas rarisocia]|uniref:FG-GAP repeat protein n=1 Tax=Maioricimonas rarisocia TaxID=2528026 RepID=A0A517Z4L8_9PLAN|nr:VCBS repeat-containing protein [Maioricimonas rarisocia]QDU37399.1 FG-GAP repeat protein [Maioricimonas rarisocia]